MGLTTFSRRCPRRDDEAWRWCRVNEGASVTSGIEGIARAVVVRDGRVLLVQERTAGYWFFPGGHVEEGETPEEAVVRELGEELGVGAVVEGSLGQIENNYVADGMERREVNHVFAVRIDAEDPESQEPDLAAGWKGVEELAHEDVRPQVLVELVLRSL